MCGAQGSRLQGNGDSVEKYGDHDHHVKELALGGSYMWESTTNLPSYSANYCTASQSTWKELLPSPPCRQMRGTLCPISWAVGFLPGLLMCWKFNS